MIARSHKLELFLHFSTIIILLLKGFDKITKDHFISGSILIALGFIVIAVVFLEKRLHLSHHTAKITCYLIESIALFVIAYVFFLEGRKYLPYVFAACALTYFIIAVVQYTKHKGSAH